MNSLWKDLLFLHGHLLHKEDLDWQPDSTPEQHAVPSPLPTPARPTPTHSARDCGSATCA